MLYTRCKYPLLITCTSVLLLSACGEAPVKPVVEAPEPVEPVILVEPEPEAEAMAITLMPVSEVETRRIVPIEPEPAQQAEVKEDGLADKMGKPLKNPDALKALIASKSAASTGGLPPVTAEDVERKLKFGRMMLMTKSGRKITESDNDDAKAILGDVKAKLDQAEKTLDAGDSKRADEILGEAMRLFNSAARMIPSEDLKAKREAEFPELKKEIDVARDLHKRNYDKITSQHGMAAGIAYSESQVALLIGEADHYAAEGDYAKANNRLEQARDMIQAAIRKMMSGRKIVYELNIDTPQGEYEYELNKFIGYEELIPIAIEKKKPTKGLLSLVNKHHEKANWMANQARERAAEEDYPKAIRMLQDATAEIRKALKIMGVPSIG